MELVYFYQNEVCFSYSPRRLLIVRIMSWQAGKLGTWEAGSWPGPGSEQDLRWTAPAEVTTTRLHRQRKMFKKFCDLCQDNVYIFFSPFCQSKGADSGGPFKVRVQRCES